MSKSINLISFVDKAGLTFYIDTSSVNGVGPSIYRYFDEEAVTDLPASKIIVQGCELIVALPVKDIIRILNLE